MLRLKGIAVSPGVAIGEALVMDNEGFRIPRRFVRRAAVEPNSNGSPRPSRPPARKSSAIATRRRTTRRAIRGHLLRPPANAPRSAAPQRTRGDDPRAALLARVCRQPHPATLRQGLPDARRRLPRAAGERHLRHREAPAATPAGPAPRGTRQRHLAGARAGPQSHAQRNGQPGSRVRAGLRHRDRRPGQPHGDRRRRARHPGRRRRRALPDRRLRRRSR